MPNITQGAPAVYVSFSAEIIPNTTEALLGVMAHCANQRVRQVTLLISTPGGSVMSGLNLYNVLRGMPFELVTHNVGNVDSIGNMVFLAGKRRLAAPQATFMFHGVGMDVRGNQRFEQKDLNERLGALLADQLRIGAVIAAHSKLTAEEVGGLLLAAQTMDSKWAVEKGIVHEIREVQLVSGAPVISLGFQRQGG